jgi:radial spoke head protein 4A
MAAAAMSPLESQKAYLKKEGVKEHLDKIIKKVISEKPQDAYGLLEILSRQVKEQSLAEKEEEPAAPSPAEEEEAAANLEKHVQKLRALDKVPVDEGGEPQTVCAVPNFVEDAEALQWAGVGFGEAETYRIMCSMRNLAAKEKDNGVVTLRFWGKILGTGADYYVAEAKRDAGDLPEGAEEGEDAPGVGANQNAYYVTNDLTGDWQKLPDIKPSEIVASRLIRRMLTGDLKAKVLTHPNFAGKEEVLLRAQIARVSADTVLCIKGFWRTPEDVREGDDEEAKLKEVEEAGEEFVCPAPAELLSLKSWTHMTPHILRSGRTGHPAPEDPEDDNPEQNAKVAKDKAEREADPLRAVLRDLTEDGMEWVSKQTGDTALYRDPVNPAKTKCNAVTYVRSLAWPGAVTLAKGGNFVNFYVGYGLQGGEPDFYPSAPPDIQDEPEEVEQPEPQGEEPPAEEPSGDA